MEVLKCCLCVGVWVCAAQVSGHVCLSVCVCDKLLVSVKGRLKEVQVCLLSEHQHPLDVVEQYCRHSLFRLLAFWSPTATVVGV